MKFNEINNAQKGAITKIVMPLEQAKQRKASGGSQDTVFAWAVTKDHPDGYITETAFCQHYEEYIQPSREVLHGFEWYAAPIVKTEV